jgi:DNA-binding CsgD family transcriptional regulator
MLTWQWAGYPGLSPETFMVRNEDIYEALFDDDAFHNLPSLFARAFDARSSMINWVHADGAMVNFAHNYFSADFMAEYQAGYIHKDLWMQAAFAPGRQNTVFNASEFVRPSVFENSELYNELIRRHGDDTFHCIGGSFVSGYGQGILGINRAKSAGAFDDQAVGRLKENAVAVGRVLAVRGEIAAHRRDATLARSVLDIVGLAAIAVRHDGRILYANQTGETILRRGDGLCSRKGQIIGNTETLTRRLVLVIGKATASFQPETAAFAIERPGGLPSYHLTVTPLGSGQRGTSALFVLRDPDAEDASLAQRLRGLFRLSPAEADLAIALARGETLSEIAARRSAAESTVRTQVKTIAAKMGCHRQAEVTAAINRLVPLRPRQ